MHGPTIGELVDFTKNTRVPSGSDWSVIGCTLLGVVILIIAVSIVEMLIDNHRIRQMDMALAKRREAEQRVLNDAIVTTHTISPLAVIKLRELRMLWTAHISSQSKTHHVDTTVPNNEMAFYTCTNPDLMEIDVDMIVLRDKGIIP